MWAATLSGVTPVLDHWHLAAALRRALRRAVAETDQPAAWATRLDSCLEQCDVLEALAVWADLSQARQAPEVGEFAAFLAAQAPRIPDYAARRAAGLPNGSGGVEKRADVVVNRRFKGKRGMRRGRARAEGVLALRVAESNDEWAVPHPGARPPRSITGLLMQPVKTARPCVA